MTREVLRIDLTHDAVTAKERMAGLAYRPPKDPHLTKLDNLAWWMVAILAAGYIIGNW